MVLIYYFFNVLLKEELGQKFILSDNFQHCYKYSILKILMANIDTILIDLMTSKVWFDISWKTRNKEKSCFIL